MKKSTLSAICALLLAGIIALVMGIGSSWFTNWDVKTWFNSWGQNSEEKKSEDKPVEGGSAASVGNVVADSDKDKEDGVNIKVLSIPKSMYREYNIRSAAESAFELTATVSPADSLVRNFTWAQAFIDPSSEWARGKDIENYTEIQVDPANTLKCTVSCLEAFGEPIKVFITYDGDESKMSSVTLNYIKRLENVEITSSFDITFNDPSFSQFTVKLNPTYGVGTVQGEITVFYMGAEFSEAAISYLNNNSFYNNWLNSIDRDIRERCHFEFSRIQGLGEIVSYDSDYLKPYLFNYALLGELSDNYVENDNSIDFDWGLENFIRDENKEYRSLQSSIHKYLVAAFNQLANNTENQLRIFVNLNYSYNTSSGRVSAIPSSTWYSEYRSLSAENFVSSLVSIDGVEIEDGDIYF